MQSKRVPGFLGGLTLFCLVSATSALAQKDSDQITSLISQARTQAWQAAQDADTLQSFTNSNMAWESHAAQLRLIQDRVNALAKTTQGRAFTQVLFNSPRTGGLLKPGLA